MDIRAFPTIRRGTLTTLQVNLGYRCNQACVHCHVEAGPKRSEEMDADTVDLVLEYLRRRAIARLELTGGAPEMNQNFRRLVESARALGVHVVDRCNLTICEVAGYEDLPEFLAANQVEVVASLPCYAAENVDRQRGDGVFDTSVRVLKRLNALGYGTPGGELELSLVFNPQGPTLPPPQEELEHAYRARLHDDFGISFTRLLTIANMPIKRFAHSLARDGALDEYFGLLQGAHREANLAAVMCRSLVSVDWRGQVYDCDFNQMLGLPIGGGTVDKQGALTLADLLSHDLEGAPIMVGRHCFGCTAGQGSSCGGALG